MFRPKHLREPPSRSRSSSSILSSAASAAFHALSPHNVEDSQREDSDSPPPTLNAREENDAVAEEALDSNSDWEDQDEEDGEELEDAEKEGGMEEDVKQEPQRRSLDDEEEEDEDEDEEKDVTGSGAERDGAVPMSKTGGATSGKGLWGFFVNEYYKRKTGGGAKRVQAKVQVRKKETHELNGVHCVQRLGPQHVGPIWVCEFSPEPGTYVATGGRDGKIVVWEAIMDRKNYASNTANVSSVSNITASGDMPVHAHSSSSMKRTPSGTSAGGASISLQRVSMNNASYASADSASSGSPRFDRPSPTLIPLHAPLVVGRDGSPLMKKALLGTSGLNQPPLLIPNPLSLSSQISGSSVAACATQQNSGGATNNEPESVAGIIVTGIPVFKPIPIRVFIGHTADVCSLAWSKSLFLASASVDKTCRLWHISNEVCLSVFKHPDLVTAVDFHPTDDTILMTGCFDKKLRLWDCASGSVLQRVQTPSLITTCRFNITGDFAVAGLYTGHCVFYQLLQGKGTAGMRYYTQIEIRNPTGTQKKGRKVTLIRFLFVPDKTRGGSLQEHMLVTTNDSRTRLYNMDDFSCVCKYRGANNSALLQIGATSSADARHIICGGDSVIVWRLKNDLVKRIFGGKKDLCDTYEAFNATSSGPVTVALFTPPHVLAAGGCGTFGTLKKKLTGGGSTVSSLTSNTLSYSTNNVNGEMTLDGTVDDHSFAPTSALQAEDDVGLNGALILAAGIDGVLGVFEIA